VTRRVRACIAGVDLRTFFTLPCRGRVGERSKPGWGPSLREVGACGGTPPRRPFGASTLPLQGRVKTARIDFRFLRAFKPKLRCPYS